MSKFLLRLALVASLLAAGIRAQLKPASYSSEHGIASWYGEGFNGQLSASGEVFDQEQLTAAHRTLAFGTKVLVRRLDENRSIVVRINDRGPFVGERIIDLSYAAARSLGMTHPGVVPVQIEVLSPPVPAVLPDTSYFGVQAGTFRNPDNARRTRAAMEEKFGAARIVTIHRDDGDLLCVQVGHAATESEAQALAERVRNSSPAWKSAFVVRIDRLSAPVTELKTY